MTARNSKCISNLILRDIDHLRKFFARRHTLMLLLELLESLVDLVERSYLIQRQTYDS